MNDILFQVMSSVNEGLGLILTAFAGIIAAMITKRWDSIQRERSIRDATQKAVSAVEEKAKTDPTLRGTAKLDLALKLFNAYLNEKSIFVDPILADMQIHAELAERDPSIVTCKSSTEIEAETTPVTTPVQSDALQAQDTSQTSISADLSNNN